MHPASLGLILLALVPPAGASADTASGEALFGRYCAACHGMGAQGDGPTAELLSEPPPDLTRMAVDNAGSFPLRRAIRRIDGREELIAHGGPMPIYGAFFEGDDRQEVETVDGPVEVSPPVLAIALYLATLQRE